MGGAGSGRCLLRSVTLAVSDGTRWELELHWIEKEIRWRQQQPELLVTGKREIYLAGTSSPLLIMIVADRYLERKSPLTVHEFSFYLFL